MTLHEWLTASRVQRVDVSIALTMIQIKAHVIHVANGVTDGKRRISP